LSAQRIIVVGASAGGLEGLMKLVGELPDDLPAPVFVVWHLSPNSPGILPDILNRNGKLPAKNAEDWETFKPGQIYVAPPDHHLMIEGGHVRLSKGPRENRFRPAVDPLFRSAAQWHGPKVIGVVLSGNLDDGTAGLYAIKERGGTAVVQDPSDALFPSMPLSALQNVDADHQVTMAEMAPLLVRLSKTRTSNGEMPMSEEMQIEVRVALEDNALDAGIERLGEVSAFTCPECHGSLRQLKEGGRVRFRCHTGHAYSATSLLSETTDEIEATLWSTIRALEECARLLRHLGGHLQDAGQPDMASMFAQKASEAQCRADLVRRATHNHESLGDKEALEAAGAL
jgi:two-component system, chemotaxis family, protein-glutamate methylesterase/glutaminase